MISYTPNFEDVLLQRCFHDVENGFYIDIGAHHPTNASVTRWFYDRGWSGINLEPGEGFEIFETDRPRDTNLNIAIADFEGETTFWIHTGNTGTSSLFHDVPKVVSDKAGDIQPRTVQVKTLPSIIDEYCPSKHIHFLKIDAEGAEEAIIKTADWKRHRPEVIVVESTEPYTNKRRKESWQDLLQQQKYKMAYFDGVNDFWVREESECLMKYFTVPVNVLDNFQVYDPRADMLLAQIKTAGGNPFRLIFCSMKKYFSYGLDKIGRFTRKILRNRTN